MYYNKKPDFSLTFFIIAFLFVTAIGVITYKKPEQVQAQYQIVGSNFIDKDENKIKIFTASSFPNIKLLEQEVNDFIKDVVVINIEYECGGNNVFSVFVHYKKRK